MSSIRPLIPLLLTAGILLGGNGLQGTLIAMRGALEGFQPSTIGFIGTFYFLGFLLGCLSITRMMRAVGHVRSFATLAAIASAGTLLLVLVIDPVMWSAIRFATGFCFAGLFTIMESWLNSGVSNTDRARVLALYRIIDIGSVTGAQFMIPVFGAGGFTIFAIMSMMITLSLVPVSLADRSNPVPPEEVGLDLARVWRISPLASIGCVAVGLTNSAFRTLSPVYAEQIGLSVADVVTFVSVSIFGGAIIQYPLGYLSDRWDRRTILLVSTRRRAAFRARHRLPGRQQPARQFRAGVHLRLVRHAAVFAVGSARQRPRRQGRVRAGQRCPDAVLLVRRGGRAGRRLLLHAGLRSAVAVPVQRRRLCHLHRHHALPDGRQAGRAGEPARALHRVAQNLDDVCQTGAPQRRRRGSSKH